MNKTVHITYPAGSIPSTGLTIDDPVDFSWNDKCVVKQTKVSFSPRTVYRYVSDEMALKKKMTANGEVSYSEELKQVPVKESFSVCVEFEIGNDEVLLGMGQYEDGIMDYRDHKEYLYESNMRIAIPFLVTTGHYGILIESESAQIFESEGNMIRFTIDCADELSYYVILGQDIDSIINGYHEITGMPSMLPRWAFGYIQSKERYQSGTELEEVASSFRNRDIPVDCIVQDWYSWEEGLWGEKKFDKKRYPDLPGTVKKLHDLHVHFMVSIWPNMSPDSENYSEFVRNGMLLENSNLYDAFDENARGIYWKQTYEEIMSSGADALWCDNAEPFSDADWSGEYKKSEEDRYLVVTGLSERSISPDRANSYGLYHAKGIYENWRRTIPDKRVVNLTRSGYTGIQKYGAILWSGDITATYDTLRKQIAEGIKMGLTGMPYWTLDIGGFFVVNDKYENRGCNDTDHKPLWFWHGDYNDGVNDRGYCELYVRWLEFGTFLPIFRSHGTDTPREPWQFGSKGDVFYDAIIKHIRLRYSLMPYLYSIGAAAHRQGTIIMRSLLMDYGDDDIVRTVDDEYLLGPAFLIAPVYTPMYYLPDSVETFVSDRTRRVYLPRGTGWYDFHTGKHHEGGQWITADAPIDRIPVFVREGSIIPFSRDLGYADEKMGKTDYIRIYEGSDGYFELYNDDGDGYGYEKGQYSLTKIKYTEKDHSVTVTETGEYTEKERFRVEYISRSLKR